MDQNFSKSGYRGYSRKGDKSNKSSAQKSHDISSFFQNRDKQPSRDNRFSQPKSKIEIGYETNPSKRNTFSQAYKQKASANSKLSSEIGNDFIRRASSNWQRNKGKTKDRTDDRYPLLSLDENKKIKYLRRIAQDSNKKNMHTPVELGDSTIYFPFEPYDIQK